MTDMTPPAGSLLIASAKLVDPNFARCVLLILDSDVNGTLGVVLNRPTDVAVGDVLAPWRDVTSGPGVFFRGGPVELDAAIAVAARAAGGPAEEPLSGFQSLTGSLGLVDLDRSPDDFLGRLAALRVYAGYTGWRAGQLAGEIAEGSWHVVPAEVSDLFSSTPERLWASVLRRQPPPLSLLTTLPADANLN